MTHIFCYWNDPETMELTPIGILDVADGEDAFSVIANYLIDEWHWEFTDTAEQKHNIHNYRIQPEAVGGLRSIEWPEDIDTCVLNSIKMRVYVAFRISY